MKRVSKVFVMLCMCILYVGFSSKNDVQAHSLKAWSEKYTQGNAGGEYQFAIINSYHIDGNLVNYCWENSTVKNMFSNEFKKGVEGWNGMLKASETQENQANMEIKYNPNYSVKNNLAYVPMPYEDGDNRHYSVGKKAQIVITGGYKLSDKEKIQLMTHELGHVWGIYDLYTVGKDTLDSIFSDYDGFEKATRHDMNAMRICLDEPWFDTGSAMQYQKSPGVWANNEWVTIKGKEYYFKGKTQYRAYKINYNPNGGTNAPSFQTKLFNETLSLSTQKPIKNYTIKYNANGGTVTTSSKTVSATFKNWNTNMSGTGTTYNPGSAYSENMARVLYAQWNNPTAGAFPNVSRPYWIFKGWYTERAGGTKVNSNTIVTANTTYYARWKGSGVLQLNTPIRANINEPGDVAYFRFTPTADGAYQFTSIGDYDTIGRLYTDNSLDYELAYNDDGGADHNFSIVYWLKKGKTYYFSTKYYFDNEKGMYDVKITSCNPTTYNVTYNGGVSDAKAVPVMDKKVKDVALTITPDEPLRTDYVFLGWNTSKTAKDPSYYKVNEIYNKKYTINNTTTLYAIWGLKGDVNRDGKVALADAQLALQFATNSATPTVFQEKIMDYNNDGKANMKDVQLIQQKALGII